MVSKGANSAAESEFAWEHKWNMQGADPSGLQLDIFGLIEIT